MEPNIEWTFYPIGAEIEVLVHGTDADMYWENGEVVGLFQEEGGGLKIKAWTPIQSLVEVPFSMMDVAVRPRQDGP
jgi:hypothetical protein